MGLSSEDECRQTEHLALMGYELATPTVLFIR